MADKMQQGFGKRLRQAREEKGYTLEHLGERLEITYQSVSNWENEINVPSLNNLIKICEVLEVSSDWLLLGKRQPSYIGTTLEDMSDRMFNEEHMYTYVKQFATFHNLYQTLKVLPYAREKHAGQVRKGKDKVPYIYHPLMLACHGLALGLVDDNLISAALLHDVCEDCGVLVEDLPVNDETKEAVRCLTQDWDLEHETTWNKKRYYEKIAANPIALMVKLLDRCNNISSMAMGFDQQKIADYIKGTMRWIYPLMDQGRYDYPQYRDAIFLIRYHIYSVVEAMKRQLSGEH